MQTSFQEAQIRNLQTSNTETPLVKESSKNSTKGKLTKGLWGLFFTIGGLGIGLVLVGENQDIREKAAGPDTYIGQKATQLESEIKQTQTTSYQSEKYGYQISFDPNLWQEGKSTNLNTSDLQKLELSLNPEQGSALVTLEAFSKESLNYILSLTESSTPQSDSLELLVSNLTNAREKDVQYPSLKSKERIKRNGKEYYKLTYKETFLGEESEYYEYIHLGNGKYYSIVAKYPQLAAPKTFAEKLVDSIFFFSSEEKSVKGLFSKKTGDNLLDEARVVELTKPSVVNILFINCNSITIQNIGTMSFLKPSYNYCASTKGTGFVVDAKGYIATNGHVVKSYQEESLVKAIQANQLRQFVVDFIRETTQIQTGRKLSTQEAEALAVGAVNNPATYNSLLSQLYKNLGLKNIKIKSTGTKYFVKLGKEPIKINTKKAQKQGLLNSVETSESVKEAELITYNYPNKYTAEAFFKKTTPKGSDTALIKVKSAKQLSFPAIKLGTIESLKEGQPLLIIGYPGLVEGSNAPQALLDYSSSAKATITQGIVSSIKSDQGGHKLVQTDASIDHGNSGGPALNQKGAVVGVATYGFESSSGNYNFLRDIEDVKALLRKSKIDTQHTSSYQAWSEGLSNFWNQKYRNSLESFEEVKKLYPIHPLADSYIQEAQAAIKQGKDRSGLLAFKSLNKFTLTLWIVGIVEVGILALIIYLKFNNLFAKLSRVCQNFSQKILKRK